MHIHIPYILVTAFDVLALAATIGALSCRIWVVSPDTTQILHKRLWYWLGISLFMLIVSSFVLFIGRTAEMSQQPLSTVWALLPAVARQTQFGHIWLMRLPVLAVLVILWFVGRRSTHGNTVPTLMLIGLMIIAFTRSATGHPADEGQFTAPEWIDWLHLLSISVWVGTLLAMIVSVFPTLRHTAISPPLIAQTTTRLSRLSAAALTIILITGVLSAYHYLMHWDNLWLTDYGRILIVKLVFVAGAIALGATNRFVYVPRIVTWAHHRTAHEPNAASKTVINQALRPLMYAIGCEVSILMAALLAASVLLHGMPPRDMANSDMASLSPSQTITAQRPVGATLLSVSFNTRIMILNRTDKKSVALDFRRSTT